MKIVNNQKFLFEMKEASLLKEKFCYFGWFHNPNLWLENLRRENYLQEPSWFSLF